jgi:PEP-CTERM motif
MNFKLASRAATAAAVLALCGGAQAASIISDTSTITGSVINFNDFDNLVTIGPLDVGAGAGDDVVFTSAANARVGADSQDLAFNGLWGARFAPTPTGDGNFLASEFVARRGELGFTFATPVASVGAFINQFQATGTTANSLRVLAYDQYGNELESFNYSVDTAFDSYNEGKFLGFQRTQADIYGFGVADGTFVMDDLTYATAPVPEPGTWALMMAGFGVLVGVTRLRARRG